MPRRDSVAHAKYTELPEAGLSWVKSLGCLLLGYVPPQTGGKPRSPAKTLSSGSVPSSGGNPCTSIPGPSFSSTRSPSRGF